MNARDSLRPQPGEVITYSNQDAKYLEDHVLELAVLALNLIEDTPPLMRGQLRKSSRY